MLVWNVGAWYRNFHHLQLKSRSVVTVVEDEFQSQPCKTIHYTYNDTLEGLRWCDLPDSVHRYSIWVRKVGLGQARFVPTPNRKIGCSKHFRAHTPIWTMYNHSLYLWWEIGWVELIWNGWISLYMLNLGVGPRDQEPKFYAAAPSSKRLIFSVMSCWVLGGLCLFSKGVVAKELCIRL